MHLWRKTILSIIKTSKLQWVHFGFESVVWAASALGEFSFLPSVFGISGFKYRYLQGHLTQGVLLWGTLRNCCVYSFVLLQELLFCVVCFVYLHVISNPSLDLNCSLQLRVGLLSVRSPWKERKWPLFACCLLSVYFMFWRKMTEMQDPQCSPCPLATRIVLQGTRKMGRSAFGRCLHIILSERTW